MQTWIRRLGAAALISSLAVLAAGGCRRGGGPGKAADGGGRDGEADAGGAASKDPAKPDARAGDVQAAVPPPSTEKFLEVSIPESVVEKSKRAGVLQPVVVWTGSDYLVLWLETDADLALWDEPPNLGIDRPDWAWALSLQDKIEIRAAAVDPDTGAVTHVVRLEGDIGRGPAGLTGPAFAPPVWHEGKIVLAWSMCNETTGGNMPCRHVVGLWNRDGSPAAGPAIAGKSRIPGLILDPALALVSTDEGLFLAWPATGDTDSGCRYEHGTPDSVRLVRIAPDAAAAGDEYLCGEVLNGFNLFRFGPGLLHVLHDEHIGNHSLLGCKPEASGCGDMFYESTNPLRAMLVTGGGYAVWYDELNEEFEVKRRCVDIVYANVKEGEGSRVSCAGIKSKALAWSEQGLVVALETKAGERHELPLAPGDRVPPDLLKKAVKGAKPHDAVWSGTSLGMARLQGKSIKFQVLGRDAF